jgi:LacI family transcriptional regulator
VVTSRDVARVAGVSQATVSRVLQGSPNVTGHTRARVLRALEETGYTPNVLARAMKTRRTGTIGVVVASITNPFYPEILEVLTERLAEVGRRMILWSTGPGEASAIEAIRQGLVDGVVFTAVTAESAPLAAALAQDAPVVLVNRGIHGVDCDQVTSDNVEGGRAVARYLAAGGHAHPALIGGPLATSTAVEREEGFRAELAGLPPERFRRGDFSHAAGHAAMTSLLSTASPPTAVFCVNDLTAFGALDAARALGVRVPEDLWLVGYDDVDMASWEAFDLTTVRQPMGEMVAEALALLLARIAEPDRAAVHRRFPSRLIVRGSTAHVPPEE